MFAVVRTGGKQYRVAAGDRITVEKLAGEAGDTVELADVLFAGDGGELKDAGKVKVSAVIIAQARGDKVVVFKKRRRHNYRRKAGHRQSLTVLRIVQVGDSKAVPKKEVAKKVEAPAKEAAPKAEAPRAEAAPKKAPAKKPAAPKPVASKVATKQAATKAPAKKAPAKKPAAKKPAAKK
jgi:large subunit ribosomal protein L21